MLELSLERDLLIEKISFVQARLSSILRWESIIVLKQSELSLRLALVCIVTPLWISISSRSPFPSFRRRLVQVVSIRKHLSPIEAINAISPSRIITHKHSFPFSNKYPLPHQYPSTFSSLS